MTYINFVVITDTPGRVATFLASRGIIEQVTDPMTQQTSYVGVRPGMEWVRVPNPIVTGGTGTELDPYVYDTRAVFLVKFAHESVDNEEEVGFPTTEVDGEGNTVQVNQYDWSKFGRWVKNNSSVVSAPVNYTINGVHAGDAYKITGEQVWLVRNSPERFGVWQ
jgi:hypothetical protein